MVRYLDNQISGFNQWNAMQANTKTTKSRGGFFWWLVLLLCSWWLIGLWSQTKNTITSSNEHVVIEDSSSLSKVIDSKDLAVNVQGIRLSDIILKEYPDQKDKNISIFNQAKNFAEIGFVSSETQTPNINTKWKQDSDNKFIWKNSTGITFERTISLNGFVINVSDKIINNSGKNINLKPYAKMVRSDVEKSAVAIETGGVVYANSKLEYNKWQKFDKKSFAYSTVNGSFGFADQYWEAVLSLDSQDQTISMKKNGEYYIAESNAASIIVPAHNSYVINTYVFAGPRIGKILDASSTNIPGLYKTMDYGWFWFFAQPMLWMINWFYDLVGNYGLAIIIMTLILRLLIWPLTRKSYTSMLSMQKMQPEMQRIQKLYANDKPRLQMEMMRLYQTHKTSPMSGCLPMIIQIPIFFALYKALLVSVPMRSANFLWISDLSVMDPIFILPIIMGLTMWWQQKIQSTNTQKIIDKNNITASTQKVMKCMPILFTIMFAWMPAGLVLYWTISNLFGIGQIYVIKKFYK